MSYILTHVRVGLTTSNVQSTLEIPVTDEIHMEDRYHGTKNWIYSKFDLDQKSGSNMIIALIQTWRASNVCQKCLWLCLYIWPLTKKRANVILTLTPPLTHVKGGIKYPMSLPCIWSLPKARSNMSIPLTPVLTRVKGVQRHHGFAYLWSLMSKAFKDAMALYSFDPATHVRSKVRSNMAISGDSS